MSEKNITIAHAKVTSKKQLSIPIEVQKRLGGIEEGQYIIFYEDKGRIYIKKGEVKPIL